MSVGKKLVAAGLAVLSLRLAVMAGAGPGAARLLSGALSGKSLVSASVTLELGPRKAPSPTPGPAPETAAPSASPSPAVRQTETPDVGEILETTISSALAIKNTTSIEVDPAELMARGPGLSLPADGAQILIIHTHASEAYTPEGQDVYVPTDADRTEDTRYNVVRVGDELAAALESFGLSVIHDREIYDYPSYTGSYSRSGAAVEKYLAEYPSLRVVIDLHRDALGSDGVIYKTMAELEDETSSQVMLLCGTNDSGLDHPLWRENLSLALYLQQAMNSRYPTLARPVALVPERYNQHLSTGSLILEVGSSGNTLKEALCAVRLFANAAGPALLELIEE